MQADSAERRCPVALTDGAAETGEVRGQLIERVDIAKTQGAGNTRPRACCLHAFNEGAQRWCIDPIDHAAR